MLIIIGLPSFALIDSLLVWIAHKKGVTEEIGISPGWLAFHYKYGILRINICKIIVFGFLGFPAFYPLEGSYGRGVSLLTFVLLAHIIKSSYYLIKYPKVDRHG
jgi:hypothetical protein